MGKDSVNISAPNLVNICVDSMDSGVYHGRLYHKYQQEPLRFNDVGALFQTMEKLFDECGYPQNTTQSRTFYRKKEKSVIKEMVPDIDVTDMLNQRGKLAPFIVHVKYRQHSTWQGEVLWVEKNKKENFRSALDFLKLMDYVLEA